VYTACNLENSFSFDKTVKTINRVCFPIHVQATVNARYFPR